MVVITETVKYKNYAGESRSKTFKIADYRSAYDCLLHVNTASKAATLIKKFAAVLSTEEVSKLSSLFAPSKSELSKRKKASDERKKALNSKKFARETDALISQMVAHPGFLSNSPF